MNVSLKLYDSPLPKGTTCAICHLEEKDIKQGSRLKELVRQYIFPNKPSELKSSLLLECCDNKNHIFHANCLIDWINQNPKCPFDQKSIDVKQVENEYQKFLKRKLLDKKIHSFAGCLISFMVTSMVMIDPAFPHYAPHLKVEHPIIPIITKICIGCFIGIAIYTCILVYKYTFKNYELKIIKIT